MDTDLKAFIRQFLDDIDIAVDGLHSGHLTPTQFQVQLAKDLITYHSVAYLRAAGETTLTPEARAHVVETVKAQVDYLNGFADAIDAGTAGSEAQIRARAKLYAGSLKASWSAGKFNGWPLPFWPGDGGSECGGACKCEWQISVLDEENGDADATWHMGGSEHHCKTCPQRARSSPYRIRGGELL